MKRNRGRQRIPMNQISDRNRGYRWCPVSENGRIEDAIDVVCPFRRREGYLVIKAWCDQLWCVEDDLKCLYLWNPWMRTYRKLPDPPTAAAGGGSDFIYGLGYDSVGMSTKC